MNAAEPDARSHPYWNRLPPPDLLLRAAVVASASDSGTIDVRGIVTPVALAAYHLYKSSDPAIQRLAARIDEMVERLVLRLNSTYGLVPPSCDRGRHAPALHNWPNNVADATRDKADASVSA